MEQLRQILIVDDMPVNIQVLAESLKDEYHVRVTTQGEKALEIARSDTPPDLILLDIMMPGMDGYEVCRLLKDDRDDRSHRAGGDRQNQDQNGRLNAPYLLGVVVTAGKTDTGHKQPEKPAANKKQKHTDDNVKPIHRWISFINSSYFLFIPQACEFRKQIDLNSLDFNQPLPLFTLYHLKIQPDHPGQAICQYVPS